MRQHNVQQMRRELRHEPGVQVHQTGIGVQCGVNRHYCVGRPACGCSRRVLLEEEAKRKSQACLNFSRKQLTHGGLRKGRQLILTQLHHSLFDPITSFPYLS